MQQYIGGTGVMAWVERIISPGHNVRKARELKNFTDRGNVSGSLPDTITGKSEGPGLPARELTHINRKTRPPQVSEVQIVNRKDEPESTRSVSSDSVMRSMILPVKSLPVPASAQKGRIQAAAAEPETQRASSRENTGAQPQIDVKKVADKVYRLMQRDLIVERERATKIGG